MPKNSHKKRRRALADIEASSGSVLADLRLPDARVLDTKARLAVEINRLIRERQLTRVTAAACLDVPQPRISALQNYQLDGLSVETLLDFTNALRRPADRSLI